MPITPEDPFHWRHYEGEMILCCVRWSLDLPLSYRNVAKLIQERGLPPILACSGGFRVFTGVEQPLSAIPEADQQVVPGGRNLYQC